MPQRTLAEVLCDPYHNPTRQERLLNEIYRCVLGRNFSAKRDLGDSPGADLGTKGPTPKSIV